MKVRYLLYAMMLVCSSCSSQILVPSWYDHTTNRKTHNWLEHSGITIITENMEVNDQHFVFDVEIKNDTDYRLKFNPEEVYYMGSNTSYPHNEREDARIEFESGLKRNYALSETEVARHFEQKVKNQRTTNLVTGVLTASLIAFDVAMGVKNVHTESPSKFHRNEALRSIFTVGGLTAMDIVREQSAMSAADAREDLYFLPEEIMDEAVIYPGQTFRGKIFFPASQDQFIRMIIPVGRNEFAMDFRWADGKEQRKLLRAR